VIRKLLAVAAPLALVAPAAFASGGATVVTTTVSNETTVTWWAHSVGRSAIRREPSDRATLITRLHYMTEEGQPEVYVVLRRRTAGTAVWLQVRIPMRPNGRTGWVRASDLGPLHSVSTRIVVDERRLRATLYRGGHAIWTSAIGIGAPGTPTPKGHFYVREKLTGHPSALYGPVALGTSDYSVLTEWPHGGVVGIHGTSEPQLLPGRVSHGCIRIPNAAVVWLERLTPVGTPILIR
jgi:lipoprotein-anchoring transpeptidase ErfK/SrfK